MIATMIAAAALGGRAAPAIAQMARAAPDAGAEDGRAPPDGGATANDAGASVNAGAAAGDAGADRSAPPAPLAPITPAYPPDALKAGLDGDVTLILTIDERGRVTKVDIEEALLGGLTESAVAAARAARFRAALDGRGHPIASRIRWIAHFTLPEQRQKDGAKTGTTTGTTTGTVTGAVTRPASVAATSAPAPAPLPANVERFPLGADGGLSFLVRERGTGKLLPGATIYIEDLGELIHLDGQARAERSLPPGAYAIVIRAAGHHQEEHVERVRSGERLARTYFVEKQRFNEYETIIHAPVERAESGVVTLQSQEIHDIAGTFGDPFRAAMLLPGVGSIISGLGYPVIRGEAPGQTGTFIDDIKVPLLYHLGAGPAVVHPLYIQELEFHAGDFPAEFGRFTGGLIRAKTVDAPTERQTMIEADLVKLSAFHSQPFTLGGHEGALTLSGRYGTLGFLARAFDPNTVLDYWDYQARLDLRAGSGTLRLLVFGSGDVAGTERITDENGDTSGEDNLLRAGFHRVDLRYRFTPARNLSVDVGLEAGLDYTSNSGSANGSSNGLGNNEPTPEAHLREWVLRPRALGDYRLANGIKLRAGVDLLYQNWQRDFAGSPLDDFPFSQYGVTSGAFAQTDWQATPGWLIAAGARADYYYYAHIAESAAAVSIDPRLSVRRRVRPGLFVKGAAGIYHSPPRFVVPWPGLEGFGLDTNGLNRSYQLALGAELALPWSATVEGQIYYNWLPRVTEFDFDVFNRQNQLGVANASRTGRSYGLELIARRRLGQRLFGWVTYTLSKAERDYAGAGWRPADFDQTQIINAVTSYALGRSWTVSGTFHFNTGRPDWPKAASGTDVVQPAENRNIDRLPSFWRIDARIEKREAFDSWYLDFYIDWFNISLRREVTAYDYDLNPTTGQVHRRSQSAILTIPTFGLRAVF